MDKKANALLSDNPLNRGKSYQTLSPIFLSYKLTSSLAIAFMNG